LVADYVPEFLCFTEECSNHDVGDCNVPDHEAGITKLVHFRQKACVYHILKSLSPSLLNIVYDTLFDMFVHDDSLLHFLPFKQTFIILEKFKDRCQDYIEEIVYENSHLRFPASLPFFTNKKCTMSADDYVTHYSTQQTNCYGQFDGLSSENTLLIRSSTSQLLQRLLQNLPDEMRALPPPPPPPPPPLFPLHLQYTQLSPTNILDIHTEDIVTEYQLLLPGIESLVDSPNQTDDTLEEQQ
jgi:hypothetical protein